MRDYLIRGITNNKEIRFLAVRSSNVVATAQESHQTSPVATAALGRSLTAGLLLGSMELSGSEISINITGNGPLEKIMVHANQDGEVRGYVKNPQVETMTKQQGKLDVAKAIGVGQLTIEKNLGLKDPYRGQIPLVSGEIAEDLTYYFSNSEQTPSSVGLGVLVDQDLTVKAAGGFIIQLLPEASEETIDRLEENLADLDSVSRLIEQGLTTEEFMEKILSGFELKMLDEQEVEFKCKCDEERIRGLISGLGKKELRDTIEQEGRVEIRCQFCGSKYQFSQKEVENILKEG